MDIRYILIMKLYNFLFDLLARYFFRILRFFNRNYSGMLIGRPIAIPYFLARKITAEDAEERRVFNRLFPLRVPLRTLRLNSLFGSCYVPGQAVPI